MLVIEPYKERLIRLCREHKVTQLFLFGSATRDDFSAESDIDLLVDIDHEDPLMYADHYFTLKSSLETLFQREVDLLEVKSIKTRVRQEIDRSKIQLYG